MKDLNNTIINLTPHIVSIVKDNGEIVNYPPSGVVARIFINYVKKYRINGIDVVEPIYGDVIDLPSPKRGTTYIVSRMVLETARKRWDLVTPQELVRDSNGVIIGAKYFTRG